MKILLTLFGLLSNLILLGQNCNYLTHDDFNRTEINGRSISQIRSTKGDPLHLQNLMGLAHKLEPFELYPGDDNPSYTFFYNGFSIDFSNQVEDGGLVNIEITSSSPSITILGKTLRVGGTINALNGYKINYLSDGGTSMDFCPSNDETIYLSIDFNNKTKVISKMTYFVLD